MINFVQMHYRLGNITGNKQYEPRASRYRQPTEYYRELLSEYEEDRSAVYTPATLSCTRASIRDFIFFLEDNSINDVSKITRNDVSDYIIAAVSRNTLTGKRNYAMLLLGKYTGLRGIDVRE